jgi:hypothetical protein
MVRKTVAGASNVSTSFMSEVRTLSASASTWDGGYAGLTMAWRMAAVASVEMPATNSAASCRAHSSTQVGSHRTKAC